MYGNASDCLVTLAFAEENHGQSLPIPTPKPRKLLKKLRRMAKRDDMDIWFEDECHFQQHGSRCTMWIPPENTDPIVLHAPTRKNVGVFGAVCITDGRFISKLEKPLALRRFLIF